MFIQLRQRSRSGGSSGDYVRVNSDDYDEDDFSFQAMASPKVPSSSSSSHDSVASSLSSGSSSSNSSSHNHSFSSNASGILNRIKVVTIPRNTACKCFLLLLMIVCIADHVLIYHRCQMLLDILIVWYHISKYYCVSIGYRVAIYSN